MADDGHHAAWSNLIVEIEMENWGTDVAGPSGTALAGPSVPDVAGPSGTSGDGEDELILPATSEPRSREAFVPRPLALIREVEFEDGTGCDEIEVIGDTEIVPEPHVCRNGCYGPDEENDDTVDSLHLDVLVELGCHCRGSMSKMCKKCIIKWFAKRILLDDDKKCEVCNAEMNKRVENTVRGAFADDAGKAILVAEVGGAMAKAHEARYPPNANEVEILPIQQEDVVENVILPIQQEDVVENGLPPHGTLDASDVPVIAPDAVVAPDAAPDATPTAPDAAPDAPGAQLVQQPPKSFWKRIRRHMCCAAPSVNM